MKGLLFFIFIFFGFFSYAQTTKDTIFVPIYIHDTVFVPKNEVNDFKWHKITKNEILVMSLQVISGVADGINQAIAHHKFGAGNKFWDYKISWQNKYANWPSDKSEAFFGSSTVFVMFTDGYHLTRSISFYANSISIAVSSSEWLDCPKKDRWKLIAKKALLSHITNRVAFTVTYKLL